MYSENCYSCQQHSWTNTRGYCPEHTVHNSYEKGECSYPNQLSPWMLRKSRKGTQLNIPSEFSFKETHQSFIARFPVLPTEGCCDKGYVLLREQMYKEQMRINREQIRQGTNNNREHYNQDVPYASSVTINICPQQSVIHTNVYPSRPVSRTSHTSISINPSVISEEPWRPKENDQSPTGVYCEGTGVCGLQSKEQGVIYLDTRPPHLHDDDHYVYRTEPPKISPFKSCFKFCTFWKKKVNRESYIPTAMHVRNQKKTICSKCLSPLYDETVVTSKIPPGKSDIPPAKTKRERFSRKLSTISETESEITLIHVSSTDFHRKEPLVKYQPPDKNQTSEKYIPPERYTPTDKYITQGKYSPPESYPPPAQPSPRPQKNGIFAKMNPSFKELQEESFTESNGIIYRWICKPMEPKLKGAGQFDETQGRYICQLQHQQ